MPTSLQQWRDWVEDARAALSPRRRKEPEKDSKMNEIIARVNGFAVRMVKVGSQVTCNPPPTRTDEDYLVLLPESAWGSLTEFLAESGGVIGGSQVQNEEDHGISVISDFTVWKLRGVDFICTADIGFFHQFLLATKVAKKLNLLSKPDRLMLFQALLYSNPPADVSLDDVSERTYGDVDGTDLALDGKDDGLLYVGSAGPWAGPGTELLQFRPTQQSVADLAQQLRDYRLAHDELVGLVPTRGTTTPPYPSCGWRCVGVGYNCGPDGNNVEVTFLTDAHAQIRYEIDQHVFWEQNTTYGNCFYISETALDYRMESFPVVSWDWVSAHRLAARIASPAPAPAPTPEPDYPQAGWMVSTVQHTDDGVTVTFLCPNQDRVTYDITNEVFTQYRDFYPRVIDQGEQLPWHWDNWQYRNRRVARFDGGVYQEIYGARGGNRPVAATSASYAMGYPPPERRSTWTACATAGTATDFGTGSTMRYRR